MTTSITTGPRAPNEEEIDLYLRSRSGIQMMELMRGISEPAAQAALAAKLLFTPPSVVGINAAPEKAKKALNAFVGFRCKYHFSFWLQSNLTFGCRLLHFNSRFQAVANEETLQPTEPVVGDGSEQVPLVVNGKSLVRHPRSDRQGQSSS